MASIYSVDGDDPSHPLISPVTNEIPSRELNPDMVHAPANTPNQPRREDDKDEFIAKIPFNAVAILRLIVGCIALANAIVQIVSQPRKGPNIFLVVLTFVILVWNLIALKCGNRDDETNGHDTSPPDDISVDRFLALVLLMFASMSLALGPGFYRHAHNFHAISVLHFIIV
jgi:hypothetical protein